MHPILFKIPLPDFLSFLGDSFTIYSYGFFIVLGAIAGITYVWIQARKRYNVTFDTINSLFLLLVIAAFVGGKVFLYFEDPDHYNKDFSALLGGRGFVFYGSLLYCIPTLLLFFRHYKLPTLPMLDTMAVTTGIVHIFGRMGCFMAGCCHGIEWHGPLAVTFSDPMCLAPLHTPLHPTQLYSVATIGTILGTVLVFEKKKTFDGQLFLLYLMLYAIGRSVIELFRGDISRGFVIDGILSHSQFISLGVFLTAAYFYFSLKKRAHRSKV